jgi:hypothetical protein
MLQSVSISAKAGPASPVTTYSLRAIELRPYQLLCLVCMLGEQQSEAAQREPFESLNEQPFWQNKHEFLTRVLQTMQAEPDLPVVLRCNAGGVFAFQDPGHAADSPEGEEFNQRRDLEILRQLDLAPGATLPARALLYRIQNHLKTVDGVCGSSSCTRCPAWQGCPKAQAGFYERGNKINIDHIIPVRSDEQRAQTKVQSIEAMKKARSIRIRPHLLMCAVCQYGMGIRPPFEFDNLPEMLVLLKEQPRTPITLVPGADWMMCGPCKRRDPDKGSCVNVSGLGGLANDLRDLNVLMLLGMKYGDTLPADELYERLFRQIPHTAPTCSMDATKYGKTSIWWDVCRDHPSGNPSYAKGSTGLVQLGWIAPPPGSPSAGQP